MKHAVVLAALLGCATVAKPHSRSSESCVQIPEDIVLGGKVVTDDGAAVAGARVALIGDRVVLHTTTDRAGRFELTTGPGDWALSAHAEGAVGAFLQQEFRLSSDRDLRIELPRTGGVTVNGHVRADRSPAGTFVQLSAVSDDTGDVFAVPVAADGTFSATLPVAPNYVLRPLEGLFAEEQMIARIGDRITVDYDATLTTPPSDAVVSWVRANAAPLRTVEPGRGLDDLAPIGNIVGNAPIVALGEATHGTREFFQLKHRVVEYLVAKQGFTVFALETNSAEALDDYVVHGKGSAREALAKTPYVVWKTEEMIDVIEWIRAWNADHPTKVRFVGFDVEFSVASYQRVAAYLARVLPEDKRATLLEPLALFAGSEWPSLEISEPVKTATHAALDVLAIRFDAQRAAWIATTGEPDFNAARRELQLLQQGAIYDLMGPESPAVFATRDRMMADNLIWLHDHQPRGTRMIVWAHNMHIANRYTWAGNMGSHLRAHFGDAYRNIGLVFGGGSFNASEPEKTGFHPITLGPAPTWHATAALSKSGVPILALDLRNLPAGPVRDWFGNRRAVRDTGWLFSSEELMARPYTWSKTYDALLYVDVTTPTHLLPRD